MLYYNSIDIVKKGKQNILSKNIFYLKQKKLNLFILIIFFIIYNLLKIVK